MSSENHGFEFKVSGRTALFSDPITRIGGEKCSYHVPTYEALKGVCKSIYWKPTIIWVVDAVRVVKPVRTQSKGVKTLKQNGGNDLSIYTYLADVEYQVRAHYEWNRHRPDLAPDMNSGKHSSITKRSIERGGRLDIFLGARECQAYVEPCEFGSGDGAYDQVPEIGYGLMYHGIDYPDETGLAVMRTRFWRPVLRNGIIRFVRPEQCEAFKVVRDMTSKDFRLGLNLSLASAEC
jgi:CRISPR-associated protein Cas5d